MGYMTVETHTQNLLHLKRLPGLRSWSLLVGITSVGLAAAYYSSGLERIGTDKCISNYNKNSWLWKLFYVTGCLFVAIQNLDEWEEATFDKTSGQVMLKSLNLYTKVLTLWKKGQEQVVAELKHIRDVSVEEEKVRYLGTGYMVVLRFATGFSHPLTQNATLGGRSDADAIAGLLKQFLGLDKLKQWDDDLESIESEGTDPEEEGEH
ncbi:CYBC1 protein, partial [Atractosteus spatula]|nr:CYBC1 protein [Atractosteus spatula]